MNEKRVPAHETNEPDPNEPRTRSDVAPKQKEQVGSGAPARLSSGLRPAVQIPKPPADPSEEDLVDDEEWDDESGPTLTDVEAPARAREAAQAARAAEAEFSHDDFPTRQAIAPMLEPLVDAVRDDALPPPPPVFSAESTAQMANAPVLKLLDLPEIPDLPSTASFTPSAPYVLPQPITLSGAPMPPPANVRTAFLDALSPNDNPPLNKLAMVALFSFLATLATAAFVAWIVYLIKH